MRLTECIVLLWRTQTHTSQSMHTTPIYVGGLVRGNSHWAMTGADLCCEVAA